MYDLKSIDDKYGFVTLADLYIVSGLECPYTYYLYGWFSEMINNVEIVAVQNAGYRFNLPEPTRG